MEPGLGYIMVNGKETRKLTRKARLSPFLSLYFWHKPIRMQQKCMRGRRWLQFLFVPIHGHCLQVQPPPPRGKKCLECSNQAVSILALLVLPMRSNFSLNQNAADKCNHLLPLPHMSNLCQVYYQYCKIRNGIPMHFSSLPSLLLSTNDNLFLLLLSHFPPPPQQTELHEVTFQEGCDNIAL